MLMLAFFYMTEGQLEMERDEAIRATPTGLLMRHFGVALRCASLQSSSWLFFQSEGQSYSDWATRRRFRKLQKYSPESDHYQEHVSRLSRKIANYGFKARIRSNYIDNSNQRMRSSFIEF